MPSKRHKSPVVLEWGDRVANGSLLAEGWVENVPLLTGVEEGGHPMPCRRHESPVVLGGEVLVVDGGLLVPGGSLVEGEGGTSVDEGVSLDEWVQKSPRRPQS